MEGNQIPDSNCQKAPAAPTHTQQSSQSQQHVPQQHVQQQQYVTQQQYVQQAQAQQAQKQIQQVQQMQQAQQLQQQMQQAQQMQQQMQQAQQMHQQSQQQMRQQSQQQPQQQMQQSQVQSQQPQQHSQQAQSVIEGGPLYQAKLPYPPVKAMCENRTYAFAMLDNVGGNNSEMSAVSLYFYNNLRTAYCAEIASCFHHVSIVEMHHLEIFGTLALQLGVDPRLWTRSRNQMVYWTPRYNQYPVELPKLLTNAIQGEERAIEKYQYQIEHIEDCNIVENLKRIILDEQIHIQVFQDLYQRYVSSC